VALREQRGRRGALERRVTRRDQEIEPLPALLEFRQRARPVAAQQARRGAIRE